MQISPEGIPARILEAEEEGRYELVVSEHVLEELREVLMRSKFRRYLPEAAVPVYLDRLRWLATHATEGHIHRISDDPEDDYLIALALASDSDYLVTGDPPPARCAGAPEVYQALYRVAARLPGGPAARDPRGRLTNSDHPAAR